jgi:iron complex transport system substrate-binding protein
MKKVFFILSFILLSVSTMANSLGIQPPTKERIVSLNGAITEIICALGKQNEIVGVDVTSTFPSDLKAQDLGHVRSISLESLLSLKPTMVLATEKDVNPEFIGRLKASGIKVTILKQEYSIQGTQKMIKEVASVLQVQKSQPLIQKMENDLKSVKPSKNQPKILFIYARGAGTLMVAGQKTPVEAMMQLAGGKNAVQGFEDYKPLTPEALITANPDVILFFDKGLQSLGGVEGALKIEGIKQTNAGKNRKIISMDGALLSGFGPRVGEAVVQLNQLIHAK